MTLLDDLGSLWKQAAPEERRELAGRLFEAIECDLDGRRVVSFTMRRAFRTQRNALPTQVSWSGSDGIRVRAVYTQRSGER